MAIDTVTGWTRSSDSAEVANKSKKIKFTGVTLDEGDLLQLQANTTLETLELTGSTFSYAAGKPDFNDLPGVQAAATLILLDINGATGMVGAPSAAWAAATKLANVSINNCGYNAAALDDFLIAFNAARVASPGLGSATTPGVLNIAGASNGIRTSASNAAVTALTLAGWTVTQNS